MIIITQNEVNAVFDEQVRLCADTLKRKTKEYTGDAPDRLGAFKATAALQHTTPQGLRNVLLISATPYQWKHIISQRVCRRNTDETRIVLLKVWKELYDLSPALFALSLTGPFCQMNRCLEGKMTCGRKLQADMTPEDILEKDYPALWEGGCR